jgi:hypothetical protein
VRPRASVFRLPRRAAALSLALAVLGAQPAPAASDRAAAADPATPSAGLASGFTIARLKYGGGGDWYGDQTSLRNLLAAARTRLGIAVGATEEAVVSPLDEALFRQPFLFMCGHGNVKFTPAEAERLRSYLVGGGFLWCDDDYGVDTAFRRELRRVLPGSELVELPFSHPLFHQVYDFPRGLPKIHEHDGGPARAFAVFHEGRMVVLYTFDTDLGDGLEDEGTHPDPPEKRDQALRMALNIVSYVLTH